MKTTVDSYLLEILIVIFSALLGVWVYGLYALLNPTPTVTVERTKDRGCITVKNKSNPNESSRYCGEVTDI